MAGISTFQSGSPFDIYSSEDSEYTGLTGRPDLVGNPAIPANAPIGNQIGLDPPLSPCNLLAAGQPRREYSTQARFITTPM